MGLFIFARFHALEGQERAVEEVLGEEVRLARFDPGCLGHQAFRSTHDPRLFFIHSHWTDEAMFEAHAALPHTLNFVERIRPLIDHKLEVTHTRPLSS